jgi:hypothetical protein
MHAPAGDYIEGPIELWGHEGEGDVMVEAKRKELALLEYREAAWRLRAAVVGDAEGAG